MRNAHAVKAEHNGSVRTCSAIERAEQLACIQLLSTDYNVSVKAAPHDSINYKESERQSKREVH